MSLCVSACVCACVCEHSLISLQYNYADKHCLTAHSSFALRFGFKTNEQDSGRRADWGP